MSFEDKLNRLDVWKADGMAFARETATNGMEYLAMRYKVMEKYHEALHTIKLSTINQRSAI